DDLRHLGEFGMLGTLALRRVLGSQRHRGEGLTEFVVQLARDPESLRLLRGKYASRALAPLRLEPFEHLVERLCEGEYLAARALEVDRALPRAQQVDLSHYTGEPVERSKCLTDEQQVETQH